MKARRFPGKGAASLARVAPAERRGLVGKTAERDSHKVGLSRNQCQRAHEATPNIARIPRFVQAIVEVDLIYFLFNFSQISNAVFHLSSASFVLNPAAFNHSI